MSKKSYKSSSKDGGHEEYTSFTLKDKYQSSDESLNNKKSVTESNESKKDVEPNSSNQIDEKSNRPEKSIIAEDPNELGAKLIKAELMGDEVLK